MDFNAAELAVELFNKRNVEFLRARNAAGGLAFQIIPAAFDEEDGSGAGAAFRILQRALRDMHQEDSSVAPPVVPNPFEVLEEISRVMSD